MGVMDGIGRQQRAGLMTEANIEARSLMAKMQTGFVDGNDVAMARRIIGEVSAAQPPWGANGFEQFNWQQNMSGAMALFSQVSQMYQAEMGQGINPQYAQALPQYAQPVSPGYVDPGYANPGYVDPGYANPGYADPGYGNPGVGAGVAAGVVAGVAGFMLLRGLEHREHGFERRHDAPRYDAPRYDNHGYDNRRYEAPVQPWGSHHSGGWKR
jgi:hypothetical protein